MVFRIAAQFMETQKQVLSIYMLRNNNIILTFILDILKYLFLLQ